MKRQKKTNDIKQKRNIGIIQISSAFLYINTKTNMIAWKENRLISITNTTWDDYLYLQWSYCRTL